MDFNIFQPLCPYSSLAYVYQDDHTRMEPVCNRNDRRPAGHSWSVCDKAHCPYFGIHIVGSNVTIYGSHGEKFGQCRNIETMAVLNPMDYGEAWHDEDR